MKACSAALAALLISAGASLPLYAAEKPEAKKEAELPGKWDPKYKPPRMADGTPDMQGIWTNASVTVLERPQGFPNLVLTPEEAERLRKGITNFLDADTKDTDPNAPAPEKGGSVGGYNTFWMDPGTRVARINGEFRSSWIVEPKNGKLPWTLQGANKFRQVATRMFANFDNPETRSPGERCTVGFGSTGGPPMLNVLYNNNYQFVQTPDVVGILVEMNHNVRMIRMNADHRAAPLRGWLGDSVGRWEGNTLVVNTTNFHPDVSIRAAIRHRFYISPDAKIEERFTRVSDREIFYEFSVEDPAIYRQVWRGEMALVKTEGPIYEYACHEGNYALGNILAGARQEEAKAKESQDQ